MKDIVVFVVAICVLGIAGNTLVIASILKQKILLKKNYYFLVLHLAICDAFVLLSIFFFEIFEHHLKSKPILLNCSYISGIDTFFQIGGVSMMLIISVLRYRAIVHPLKLSFSRQKIKIVCGLAYIIGLVTTVGMTFQECIVDPQARYFIYELFAFYSCFYIFPIIFMTVTYSIIAQALIKQRKALRTLSNPTHSHLQSSTSSSLQRYNRHSKTFIVCVSTVLCFTVGHACFLVVDVLYLNNTVPSNSSTNLYVVYVLRLFGSHALNPLIYGILDRKMLFLWKCCPKIRPI
ncbi:bombesin receptor subtype-3-like [Xenia sp. Carnegie-2017]|uniref:bombesin receptor subtype-3-like n=1 Tax=Xenia sp. Carnegie-2017 TaxID=2897299 RepID=UPI001F04BA0D|nr:bombesin receptor subtype-3-like [Xenia sp. Carnegie-2017]